MASKTNSNKRPEVIKGQVYQYKANKKGSHLRFFKIVGVSKGQQPKASYRQITRSGNLVSKKHKWEPTITTTWLSWEDAQWVFPFGHLVGRNVKEWIREQTRTTNLPTV